MKHFLGYKILLGLIELCNLRRNKEKIKKYVKDDNYYYGKNLEDEDYYESNITDNKDYYETDDNSRTEVKA